MAIAKYAELLERPPQVSLTWKAALYIRLSREDGDKVESNSITSQREILKEYLKLHPDIELYDFYVDDGWTGTNFDRPDFKRMMEDIYSGQVNCVIVKDLSRFGRNYTDSGHYLDNVFVRYQIRFIALNNGVDTAANNMNAATRCITVGVQNVINESLAATTSVNVRGTLNVNREQGKFIGSFATYGYMKDPENPKHWIIDPEAAKIVKYIFDLCMEGRGPSQIANVLREKEILTPTAYKHSHGINSPNPLPENPYGWKLVFNTCKKEDLDENEKATIKHYAEKGFQLYNKTAGGQGTGKAKINEYRPPKTYHDGILQGKKMLARELANIAEKHLEIGIKEGKKGNKISINALHKFNELLDECNYQ